MSSLFSVPNAITATEEIVAPEKTGPPTMAIIGAVIGSILVVIIIILAVWVFRKRRRNAK